MASASAKRYKIAKNAEPKKLVVCCGDPRFIAKVIAFMSDEFNLELENGDYVIFPVPGGIAPLSEPERLPAAFEYVAGEIGFYLGHFKAMDDVVVINHEGCGKYGALCEHFGEANFVNGYDTLKGRQHGDFPRAFETIRKISPRPVQVTGFYNAFSDSEQEHAHFERI